MNKTTKLDKLISEYKLGSNNAAEIFEKMSENNAQLEQRIQEFHQAQIWLFALQVIIPVVSTVVVLACIYYFHNDIYTGVSKILARATDIAALTDKLNKFISEIETRCKILEGLVNRLVNINLADLHLNLNNLKDTINVLSDIQKKTTDHIHVGLYNMVTSTGKIAPAISKLENLEALARHYGAG